LNQENCTLEILPSGKLCTGNPSIREIVLCKSFYQEKIVHWKSFYQENCTLGVLPSGKIVLWKSFYQENCTLEILPSGKLYSGNPFIRKLVKNKNKISSWKDFQCTIFPDGRISRVQFS
jgi:hypothetical protein